MSSSDEEDEKPRKVNKKSKGKGKAAPKPKAKQAPPPSDDEDDEDDDEVVEVMPKKKTSKTIRPKLQVEVPSDVEEDPDQMGEPTSGSTVGSLGLGKKARF
ncbi:MAG: hypothetical protein EBQ92_08600 [Proteobacteria bacterium]|nr:hypothetical protein [Pseudomonadota bacterium]